MHPLKPGEPKHLPKRLRGLSQHPMVLIPLPKALQGTKGKKSRRVRQNAWVRADG